MLVLCRKPQQQIQIGENIVITVLQVKGHTVRIGIEAPRDVHVLRTELNITPDAVRSSAEDTPCHSQPPPKPRMRPINRLRRWPMATASLPPKN